MAEIQLIIVSILFTAFYLASGIGIYKLAKNSTMFCEDLPIAIVFVWPIFIIIAIISPERK